ncbi:hypothetical protein ACIPEQ_13490 [Curtobacterium sp. NPDC087080]|uniref:hypothetical protein n=1 Tax=Curtobacterium sp. NPDC087080 TaxID=3363965 RepID=UPI00380007A3
MKSAAQIRADGVRLTRAERDAVCQTFREEIGGLYAVAVAPMIEADHPFPEDAR